MLQSISAVKFYDATEHLIANKMLQVYIFRYTLLARFKLNELRV